jgi:hypothetical protein
MMYEKVVQLTSDGHPDKPTWLYNLGQSFLHRFEKLGTVSDINKSVLMFKDAVKLTPDDHPRKPAWLTNLGISLVCRYELGDNEKAHQISDLETAILHFTSAASSNIGSTSARFNAASLWAKCAQTAQNQLSLDAYAVALQLLSQLAWLGLSIPDRHHHLLKAGAVVRDAVAAAIELKQYETAVEWLEQGRSVVWGQLLQLRTSIDHLQKSHPILGNQLKYLSQALEGAGSQDDMLHSLTESPQSVEASVKQYHHLAQQRDELLKKIRTLAGFEMFLFPKKFSQLITAAHGGPVITVNVSTARCDALILLPDCNGVLHIPLKQFTYENAEQLKQALYNTLRSRSVLRDSKIDRAGKLAPIHNVDPETEFRTILSQLWESVVRPILNGMTITVSICVVLSSMLC